MEISDLTGTEEVVFPAMKKIITAAQIGKNAMPDFIGNETHVPDSVFIRIEASFCMVERGTDNIRSGHIVFPLQKNGE